MNRLTALYEKSKDFEIQYRKNIINYIKKIKTRNRIKFKLNTIICKKHTDYIDYCNCNEFDNRNKN